MSAGAPAATATLELEGLSAGYDGPPVIRDITLSVAPGEVVALMGANGAGKTTTLRAISGLLAPVAGSISLEGRDQAGVSPPARVRAGIVHVPQDRGIFFGLTVAEHFRLDGHGDDHEAAFEHFPALRDLGGRRAGLLSGGEQQMLAIARALMSQPRLLLLDEPSLGLAPKPVAQLFQAIEEIRRTGVTVVLVEQNVRATLEIADHAFVLENGRVEISGRADTLLADPRVQQAYLGL